MLRAIYLGDIVCDNAPVFEYNSETNKFHMVSDEEFAHDFTIVMNDRDWVVFAVGGERVILLDTPRRMTDEEIEKELHHE